MNLEDLRAEYRKIRARSHALENDRGAGAKWFDREVVKLAVARGSTSPQGYVEAARLVRVPCRRCIGSGMFTTRTENNLPKGPGGICFRCNGKGFQTDADARRNYGADLHVKVYL